MRKEIINQFPQLKERRSSFSHQMLFYRDYDSLEKAIKKMKSDKLPPPLLLFFRKEYLKDIKI